MIKRAFGRYTRHLGLQIELPARALGLQSICVISAVPARHQSYSQVYVCGGGGGRGGGGAANNDYVFFKKNMLSFMMTNCFVQWTNLDRNRRRCDHVSVLSRICITKTAYMTGPTQKFIFYTPKHSNSEFVYPKNSYLFSIPKNISHKHIIVDLS